MANTKRRTTIQSLERGLGILDLISNSDEPLGITDLSRQLGLAKGSVARLVTTLVNTNYLTRVPGSSKYRLGLKIWDVGHRALAGLDVLEFARPVMKRLNETTGDTVHVTVLSESGSMVFLDKVDSTKGIRPDIQLGVQLPAYCVANGKATLAFLPAEQVKKILKGRLERYTDTTIVKKSQLESEFEMIRRKGYATNRGEYRTVVSGVGAPIVDHANRPIAALGISAPTSQMTSKIFEELGRRVAEAAKEISLKLGHTRNV